MALSGSIKVDLIATLVKALDLASGNAPLSKSFSWTIASGVAANQADRVWHDRRTTSGTDSLDLAGALLDAFGDAFTPARVKAVLVVADGANAADIRVTRPAAGVPILGASGDYVVVRPGGVFLWAAPDATGVAVTATTADLIDIVSASGSVTYDIVIVGASS